MNHKDRRGYSHSLVAMLSKSVLPLLVGCFAAGAVPAQAPDVASVVAGLQRRYAAVESIRADFTQNYRAPGIAQTESGVMYMNKPGLMRWEYKHPEPKLFVADGRNTYVYTPEDRQVVVQRFTLEDMRSTPLQFLLGQGDIRRSYEVSWEVAPAPAGGDFPIRLMPRTPDPNYSYIVIACDRASFDLRRLLIHEHSGNVSEFQFRDPQVNVKIDRKQFEFKIPKGVEVIRLDDK